MQHDRLSAIGILTAGVAHEINNPVNFISSSTDPLKRNIQNLFTIWQKYSEIKEGEELELSNKLIEIEKLKQSFDLNYTIDESKQLMKGISDGIHRITIIMKDLKTFSKENEEVMVKADIHQGIDATLTLLKPRYKDRIKIHKNYAKLSEINCYYGKLNQVFMNIISNAIEAIPDKGEIDITTVENDNQIKIIIKDNGLGISESDAKKIFNPFFTTKSLGKGTGLGLSIASSIIQDHKGSIEVESKIGKGAKFTIILPLH
jgi:signal transduction histidine kinase